MLRYSDNDTIAAISTPLGAAGIGIVRMSGRGAVCVAEKIFVSKDGKSPKTFKTFTTHYGWIVKNLPRVIQNLKPARPKEFIDEVILTVMLAPKSYTKEDIIEINCHGGIVAMRAVLDLVLENGCRLAEPGEFTKRAFLNGRIDLAQAEAVLDIIKAKTDYAFRIGVEQLRGNLSSVVNNIRKGLLSILTLIEADIDFPDEELKSVNLEKIAQKLTNMKNQLSHILADAKTGRILREGVNVVICGKPNVGKSSLLNALLKQERSIVTPIPGTTRDTVEEVIDIKGIPVRIVDTAGILEPKDLIEKKAIQRSRRYINAADLVFLLFDGSRVLNRDDMLLIKRLKYKTTIAIINKIDIKQKIARGPVQKNFKNLISISAKKLKNINLLEDSVADLVFNGRVGFSEPPLVSNFRHIEAFKAAENLIAHSLDSLDNNLSLEFIAQDIRDALSYFDEVLGKKFSDELIDKIFCEFCVGK